MSATSNMLNFLLKSTHQSDENNKQELSRSYNKEFKQKVQRLSEFLEKYIALLEDIQSIVSYGVGINNDDQPAFVFDVVHSMEVGYSNNNHLNILTNLERYRNLYGCLLSLKNDCEDYLNEEFSFENVVLENYYYYVADNEPREANKTKIDERFEETVNNTTIQLNNAFNMPLLGNRPKQTNDSLVPLSNEARQMKTYGQMASELKEFDLLFQLKQLANVLTSFLREPWYEAEIKARDAFLGLEEKVKKLQTDMGNISNEISDKKALSQSSQQSDIQPTITQSR